MYTKSSSVRNPMSHFAQQQPPDVFDLTTAVDGRHKGGMSAGFSSRDKSFDCQPTLTDEQHEHLIDECLKRTPFDNGPGDPALAAVEQHNHHQWYQHDSTKILDDQNTTPYQQKPLPPGATHPGIGPV
jgi:hypothetical protein